MNATSVDQQATQILMANNSLRYGRTTDVETFFVTYSDDGNVPLGVGFGSFGYPQSWNSGLGSPIDIPSWVPVIGGRHIVTYKDDQPLTPEVDGRVIQQRGKNVIPWDTLETDESLARRLYISTPNHLFDFRNRNPSLTHLDQKYGVGEFKKIQEVPNASYQTVEDIAKSEPDESNPDVRKVVELAAQALFGRSWLF